MNRLNRGRVNYQFGKGRVSNDLRQLEMSVHKRQRKRSSNQYDVFGNRIEKDVTYSGQATTTTKFAMDGWNPATPATYGNENFSIYADLNADGSLATRYIRGDVVDQIFARIGSSSGTAWYLLDN